MRLLFRTLSWLPLWLAHALGWILGWFVFLASATYRRRFMANLAQAGVPWSRGRAAVGQAGMLATFMAMI